MTPTSRQPAIEPAIPAIRNALYYRSLTGVRAVAALMVFIHHGNPFNPAARTSFKWLPQSQGVEMLRRFVEQWHIGVTIFFVLSGFLIASRYQDRIEPTLGWARRYLQNRFARIYPLYFLLTIVFIGCWWVGVPGWGMPDIPPAHDVPLKDKLFLTFLNLTFLRGFFDRFLFSGVLQGWSLTVEECFYILAPFVLLMARHHLKRLIFFPLLLGALGVALVQLGTHSPVYLYAFMPSVKFMLNWTIFGRATEFAIGIALAMYVKRCPYARVKGCCATTLGGLWILLSIVLIAMAEYPHFRSNVEAETYAAITLNNLILPVGIAVFFWGLVHEQSKLRRLFETELFQVLGKSSYALYLVHFGLLGLFLFKYTHNLLLIILATQAVAYLLWRFFEEPLHKKLKASFAK